MKFIHTSDWHLGKSLDGYSRLEEQKSFCRDFIERVNDENVDMVIIAGDVYDSAKIAPEAEQLFYNTISKISNNGQRCVLVIRGDNDNLYKLGTIHPLAYSQGIVVIESITSRINPIKHKGFEILESKDGCIKLDIKGEKVSIITIPYTTENEVEQFLTKYKIKDINQNTYTQKMSRVLNTLEENFNDDTINIVVGHMPLVGCENRPSEKNMSIGINTFFEKRGLPNKAQYIALGHLHKMQKVSETLNTYYSGSPIQYSKEEKEDTKGGYLINIEANKPPVVEEIYFDNYKPIEVFTCNEVKEALEICKENKDRDIWSYFEINTDESISLYNIKRMKETLKDIVQIKLVSNESTINSDITPKPMGELFKEFYESNIGQSIKGELMDLFLEITNKEGGI